MSILPQLTFSTGCQLPPAAPSSVFEFEDNAFCSSSRPVVPDTSNDGHSSSGKPSSKSSRNTKSGSAAELRGMRAAEETLQWLAARVLQQVPPPHMLPLGDVFERLLRLDAVAASRALLHITRNIAKVLQASRLLFVGSRVACEQCLARRLEEEAGRLALEQQEQQRVLERESQEHTDKTEKRWDGEGTVDSWEQHLNPESDAGSHEKEAVEREEDADDWSSVPVRDEQSSCFPWLVPHAAAAATAEAEAAGLLGGGRSVAASGDEEDETATDDDDDNLFVLLQPVSAAEEALGCRDVLIKLCNFLSVRDVISVSRVCRATVSAALSEDVWMPLLQRSFPKASLVNEDTLESAEEQQRIDQEKHKQASGLFYSRSLDKAHERNREYRLLRVCQAASRWPHSLPLWLLLPSSFKQLQIVDDMLVQIPPDKPVSLAALLLSANKTLAAYAAATASAGELRLRMDAEALLHLLSCHPDTFKQDAAGQQFVVQPSRLYSDWLPVNPYAVANWGPERTRQLQQDTQQLWREEQCEAGAVDPQHPHQHGEPPPRLTAENGQNEADMIFRRDLSARQAYRLWHTKLLGAEQNRERPWEYFNACSEISSATKSLVHKRGLLLPAGALLDLCERRLRFVRLEDPMTVHTLVLRTLDGVMYHIPSGCFNRRVNLLQQALCSPHLRLERETRKRIERRLLDFMQHVRNERKFGFFACRSCGSRWRSGFTYDEIAQQCLRCGLWNKAFKCQPLRSAQEVNALQKNPAAPLQPQQHQADALPLQQHRPADATAEHQHRAAQQRGEVTGTPQDQQQEVRHAQQILPQHSGGRQQQRQQGGIPRERPRQQQQNRSAREQHRVSSGVPEQSQQPSETEHLQCYDTEQNQQHRGQPRQRPCGERPQTQQAWLPSRSARLRQERRRGTAQHMQGGRGPARCTAATEEEREYGARGKDAQEPLLPHADQEPHGVKHVQDQTTDHRGKEDQQGVRSTREQQRIHTRDTRHKVRTRQDPKQTRGRLTEPILGDQSCFPPEPLPHHQLASLLLSPSHDRRWQAMPQANEYGQNCSDEGAGCSSGRREVAKGRRHDVGWKEMQHQGRKQEERGHARHPISNGILSQELRQPTGHQDVQLQQNQSPKPHRRNDGRVKDGHSVRESRRDVPNGVNYHSRSELVRRVLQQQLRPAAREERL